MFYSIMDSELLTRSEAQFAVGIALAQMNASKEIVEAVICFGGTYWDNKFGKESNVSDRKMMDEFVANYGSNTLKSVIEFFASNAVLPVRASGNRGGSKRVALFENPTDAQIEELYQIAMQIVFSYGHSKLLLPYMDTKYFKEKFNKALSDVAFNGANGFGRNFLSQNVRAAIHENFKLFIDSYSVNSYDADSGNPTGYLVNAFKSFYVKESKKKNSIAKMYDILNQLGQDRMVGEDDTALANSSLQIRRPKSKLNFIVTATKIERASNVLFNYSGSSMNYYDIFSHYRDSIMSDQYKTLKEKIKPLRGVTVVVKEESPDFFGSSSNSLFTKFSHKKEYCNRLVDAVINKGFRREDAYLIYKSLIAINNRQPVTDGIRVFSSAGHDVRNGKCNSEIFQVLLDGYCALRDLLEYIDGKDSISLQSFPVSAFRNKSLIRRFRSVESYIANHDYVCGFVNEINADGMRATEVSNTLFSNDYVYTALANTMLLKSNEVIEALRELPLSAISGTVKKSTSVSIDKVIMDDFDLVYRLLFRGSIEKPMNVTARCMSWYQFGDLSFSDALKSVIARMRMLDSWAAKFKHLADIQSGAASMDESTAKLYAVYGTNVQIRGLHAIRFEYMLDMILFLNSFELFAKVMHKPLSVEVDGDGNATQPCWGLEEQNLYEFIVSLLKPFVDANASKPEAAEFFSNSIKGICNWLKVIMREFVPSFRGYKDDYEWNTNMLMHVYNVKELVSIYLMAVDKIMQDIAKNQQTRKPASDAYYLSYAIAASNPKLLKLRFPVSKLNDLVWLYNSTGSRQRYGYPMSTTDRAQKVTELNESKLSGINDFVRRVNQIPQIFSLLDERSFKVITATGYLSNEDPAVTAALRDAAAAAVYDVQTAANPTVSRDLCDHYSFDEDGYMRDGNSRLSYTRVINEDSIMGGSSVTSYIHLSGIIVNIYIDNTYDTEVITENSWTNLKSMLRMRLGW